jgi:hypothetical protein
MKKYGVGLVSLLIFLAVYFTVKDPVVVPPLLSAWESGTHASPEAEKGGLLPEKRSGEKIIKAARLLQTTGESRPDKIEERPGMEEPDRARLITAYREKHSRIKKELEGQGFDFEALSEELRLKLKRSENGKVQEEEILSLLPVKVRDDFREMMLLLRKIMETEGG